MNREEITTLLIDIIYDYFETQDIEDNITKETVLFGQEAILDSMGLVNVIVDIESHFLEDDMEILLTSEKAMSRKQSPFRTISTLAEFIEEQINENDE